MSTEGATADNTIVEVEEKCVVNEKLTRIDKMKIAELKKELKERKLKATGKKKELQDRLKMCVAIEVEHGADEEEDEEDEEEDEEDEEEDGEDEDVRRGVYVTRNRMNVNRPSVLTFKDVKEAVNTFSGDDSVNVEDWLQKFEEMCDLGNWTDAHRVVFARLLLRGSARLFVGFERCCKSWKTMKEKLCSEFTKKASSGKGWPAWDNGGSYRKEDSGRGWSAWDSGGSYLKTEGDRGYMAQGPQRGAAPAAANRCPSCGARGHQLFECPTREKGVECVECRGYGHIAVNCPSKKTAKKISYGVERTVNSECRKDQDPPALENIPSVCPVIPYDVCDVNTESAANHENLEIVESVEEIESEIPEPCVIAENIISVHENISQTAMEIQNSVAKDSFKANCEYQEKIEKEIEECKPERSLEPQTILGTVLQDEEIKCQRAKLTPLSDRKSSLERLYIDVEPVKSSRSVERETMVIDCVNRILECTKREQRRKTSLGIREAIETERDKLSQEERERLRECVKRATCRKRKATTLYREYDRVARKEEQVDDGSGLGAKRLGPHEVMKVWRSKCHKVRQVDGYDIRNFDRGKRFATTLQVGKATVEISIPEVRYQCQDGRV